MDQSEALERMTRRSFARRVVAATAVSSGCGPVQSTSRRGEVLLGANPRLVRGDRPRSVYPEDIDGAIGDHLRRQPGLDVKRARLGDPSAGLADEALDATDVLIWWGRLRHNELPDHRAKAIAERVRAGKLGFVALHASCCGKPFRELMGESCEPGDWSEDGRPERVSVEAPDHEIARGVAPFTIPRTAMFAEPFKVPRPETVVFMSKFDGDVTFRSGLTWTVGKGRVAYFRPGHDAFPVFYHPSVRRVIPTPPAGPRRRKPDDPIESVG